MREEERCGVNEEERYLKEMLSMLQNEYNKAAKPYIDRIVAIRMMEQPRPMILTIEQAKDVEK